VLANRLGSGVVAGIRPEHVAVLPPDEAGETRGSISYREPRGDADVLTIAIGDGSIYVIAETNGPSTWRAGDNVALRIAADQLHVFDQQSGRNIEAAP
jgi:ABC-type sugar transport system ATPase subunit